jgi:AcrR family transcriptional regulator
MTEETNIVPETVPDGEDAEARGRGHRRRDRELAIIAAAMEEFCASGLTNARLDDIAARAGVAKGTLYLYFQSKEELFKAALRSRIHPLLEQVERQVADFKGPTEELLRMAIKTMYVDMAQSSSGCELMRLMVAEGHRMPEISEFYFQEIAARSLATLHMIIWRGIALGEFRRSPAAEFPHLVLAPCKLSMTWQLMFGERHALDVQRYADAHVEFVLAALRV